MFDNFQTWKTFLELFQHVELTSFVDAFIAFIGRAKSTAHHRSQHIS